MRLESVVVVEVGDSDVLLSLVEFDLDVGVADLRLVGTITHYIIISDRQVI